jgi:peptidase S41-like protein
MGPNADLSQLRVDAAARAKVIEGAIAQLDSFYVFPEVAKRIADSLRYWNAHARYDSYVKSMSFAIKLNEDVRALGHDKHMRVDYSVRPIPPRPATPPPRTPEDIVRQQAQVDQVNCAFQKVENLDGNIGYVKFNAFFDVDDCAATASAAMNFVAGSRALVIDLRDNGGGQPAMVSYIASYLFSKRTHLNDIWERRSGRTQEFWTRDDVPGRKFGGEKPVYVLTSSNTFSGGEEFTYNLKTQKRATIVGETTGGGAHPVSGHRIDEHFIIGVPFARAINPITHTNWEGTGVEPDVKVPAADALTTALRMIREGTRP